MKTEEDEAFDELAKRQGSWGGGFKAKQAMAADKLQGPAQDVDYWIREATAARQAEMALRRELEAQPAQEPVAWALEWTFDGEEKGRRLYDDERHCKLDAENDGGICRPLVYGYTTPPQREWVGLTAEDFSAIKFPAEMRFPAEFRAGARWAEVKLKEKNT